MTERLDDHFSLSAFTMPQGHKVLHLRCGDRGTERIVPPAGEAYAFDVQRWARRVEVSVSPKGQSVRVWVDGKEVT